MIRDTLTHLDLSIYPEVALVIFLGVFAMVSVRALRRGTSGEARYASRIPLDDGAAVSAYELSKGSELR
ncbi:MAG: hypothetical protein H6812_06280 [Phycisphaeraceae bacterium]|nr:hypothetical protein [Phycisphaerales bacterium]MCB9842851.1 hypothetical protein [Phycisphaeraceae bacterium]